MRKRQTSNKNNVDTKSDSTHDSETRAKDDPKQGPKSTPKRTEFPVVGIGASAGGLEAFEKFFTYMPTDSGAAFVIITHLSPDYKSLMAELLQNRTKMQVFEVTEEMTVQQNCIYTIPPGKDMTVSQGVLHLSEPRLAHGFRHPIDFFFRTLAQDAGDNAIGIVFSGTGTEGTQGIRDIKGEGGMAMVQEPSSAKYDSMPRSAIATGLVDYILPPEEMPEYLMKYIKQMSAMPARLPEKAPKTVYYNLQKIYALIRERTGHDFSLYKPSTIIRRIERRISVHQLKNMSQYLSYLQQNPAEIDRLFRELLIGVTVFFRDPDAFKYLATSVIPEMIAKKQNDDTFRVWIPGCSTGEEAYSLAIIIRECITEAKKSLRVQIFATDLDEEAIEQARLGIFPESLEADVSPERVSRFFTKLDTSYKIKEEIRSTLIFAPHNVISEPPFSRLDMISCRNLLIYLGPELQKYLINLFHYALKPEGILFLGSSESIGGNANLFSVICKKWRIFQQKPGLEPRMTHFDFSAKLGRGEIRHKENGQAAEQMKVNIEQKVEQLALETFTPSMALIDEKGDILYLHGRTSKYLEPAPGKPEMNIFTMARQGLRYELKLGVKRVLTEKEEIVFEELPVRTNGDIQYIDLIIKFIQEPDPLKGLLLVVFRDVKAPFNRTEESTTKIPKSELEKHVVRLEQELNFTRENLQTTIEELETSNEELKSANEELQSTNEELQSTNEELETSKEELQSVNEELVTVNTEFIGKIDELQQVQDDLSNLLTSIDIATLFLDNNLRIKRFTPAATKIINLIPSDEGRPIVDLTSNLMDENLVENSRNVLSTLKYFIKEVQDREGNWYLMRILPYRTTKNIIDGVVITFLDVTALKQMEEKVQSGAARYRALFETFFDGIVLLKVETGEIFDCNPEFARQIGRTADQIKGMKIWELTKPDMASELKQKFQKVRNKVPVNFVDEFDFLKKDGTTFPAEFRAAVLACDGGNYIQGIVKDVSGRK